MIEDNRLMPMIVFHSEHRAKMLLNDLSKEIVNMKIDGLYTNEASYDLRYSYKLILKHIAKKINDEIEMNDKELKELK
jgi:hypothetical protein